MKTFIFLNFFVWTLVVAAPAYTQTPPPPQILYGTTTPLAAANEFAVAATRPTQHDPRARYVVVAKVNNNQHLEVLAWHDTTSSLASISVHGTAAHEGVVSVAVTALDAARVVTADIDQHGILSLHTWRVGSEGVISQRGYRTAAETAAHDVAIATVNCGEVVTAYKTTAGFLVVEAWTISDDGLPAPKAVLGKGQKASQVSIAAIGPHQVITATGDSKQALRVDTWQVDSVGIKLLDHVKTANAVSPGCVAAPRPQTVAVGAEESFQPVRVAFTPVITPGCQLQVYYWSISPGGALTLESTTTPTEAGDFAQVAASMLSNNIPITSYDGGTGDNHVFLEQYFGFNLVDLSAATYGDPFGVVNIAAAPAGTDVSSLSLFNPYNAYFISAAQFNPQEFAPDGTLVINVLSYPEAPIL